MKKKKTAAASSQKKEPSIFEVVPFQEIVDFCHTTLSDSVSYNSNRFKIAVGIYALLLRIDYQGLPMALAHPVNDPEGKRVHVRVFLRIIKTEADFACISAIIASLSPNIRGEVNRKIKEWKKRLKKFVDSIDPPRKANSLVVVPPVSVSGYTQGFQRLLRKRGGF